MFDRRNPEHPLGRMIQAGPLWTLGQFARANNFERALAGRMIQSFWKKDMLNILDIACKLIPVPECLLYRHEPRMPIHAELPKTIADTLAARYRAAETQEVRVYLPTRRALSIFGMPHAPSFGTTHATHDLLLVEIWLMNCHRGRWELDPQPPGGRKLHEVQPDAGIFSPGKRAPHVFIECCGSYRADRIAALLAYSESSGIPLELW